MIVYLTLPTGVDKNKPVNDQPEESKGENSNVGGKRSARTTRNPNPIYVDSIGPPPFPAFNQTAGNSNEITLPQMLQTPWSATREELAVLNRQIGGTRSTA